TNEQIQQVTPTYIRSHIQPSISSYIPQTIQQPFLQTTNQQVRPTYIPPAIQPSISSYIPQTIQQPFLQTTNQEIQQP
ncbi:unnamed protein product, partial [Rotaria sp. Silwood1]